MTSRNLGVGDLLLIAAEVLGVPAEALASGTRLEILQSALDAPAARLNGTLLYPDVAERGAVLLTRLIHDRPFRKGNLQIAAVAIHEFVTRSGCSWRRDPFSGLEAATTASVLRAIANGAPYSTAATWLGRRIVRDDTGQLPLDPEKFENLVADGGELWPQIYIATALASAPNNAEADRIISAITAGLLDTAQRLNLDWRPRLFIPSTFRECRDSPSHGPDAVYARNSKELLNNACALILVAVDGSIGAGLNLSWAAAQLMPILIVHPRELELSRLAAGMPGDITIRSYDVEGDSAGIAAEWMEARADAIADGIRRRTDRLLRFARLQAALRAAWDARNPRSRLLACGTVHMHPRRARQLLLEPGALAVASLLEVEGLARALGVDLGRWLTGSGVRPPTSLGGTARGRMVTTRERRALETARRRNGWSRRQADDLLRAARRELLRPHTSYRLRLDGPEAWEEFRNRLERGEHTQGPNPA